MSMVIDFHSHVLPGIDDGSASLEESIAMLRQESEQGIGHVVATPHFYGSRDNLDRFLERRAESVQLLREETEKHTGLPGLSVGAEVHFFTGISESRQIANLTISGTEYIMIEMPHGPWTDSMYRELEQIYVKQGLVPILAHLDRYLNRFRAHSVFKNLELLPVLVQANGSFFLNKATSAWAMRLLKKGKIHLLGSDCHNLTSRKPNLGLTVQAIEKSLGEDAVSGIMENGQEVLFGPKNA